MYVLGNSVVDLEPNAGSYTKTQTISLTASRFYKFIFGAGETDVFAPVDGDIPVYLNVHAQGGNAVECSVSGTTLTVISNYPGLGSGLLVEYANVVEDSTDVRSYVTNWSAIMPNLEDIQSSLGGIYTEILKVNEGVSVNNWPSSYPVSGTVSVSNMVSEVSLSTDTINALATAIASAISGG